MKKGIAAMRASVKLLARFNLKFVSVDAALLPLPLPLPLPLLIPSLLLSAASAAARNASRPRRVMAAVGHHASDVALCSRVAAAAVTEAAGRAPAASRWTCANPSTTRGTKQDASSTTNNAKTIFRFCSLVSFTLLINRTRFGN